MNVAANGSHAAQRSTKANSPHATPDTFAEPINNNGPDDVAGEFEEDIEYEHTRMMALIGQCEKTGKPGYSA
jgi:hypothetical protein